MAVLRSTGLKSVTSYVKNVGKSIAYASVDALGDSGESFKDFAETNEDLFKEVYAATKNYKKTLRTAERNIRQSKIYVAADQALKSIFEDIKTGQFYNKKREKEMEMKSMGSDFNMDDWDTDFNFDDDDWSSSDSGRLSDEITSSIEDSAASTSNVIARSVSYATSVSKANARLQTAQMQELTATVNAGFTGLKSSIDIIRDAVTGPVQTHLENSKTFFETSTKLLQEQNAMMKEVLEMQRNLYQVKQQEYKRSQYAEVSSGGIPDIKEYAKQIKKNALNILGPEFGMLTGNTFGGADSNLMLAFAGSPLKVIPQMIVKNIIPATVKTAMESLDEGFSTLFSNINARLLDMAKNDEGTPAGFIGRLLGLKYDEKTSISINNYKQGPVPWDGIARKTLVDVIPTHLRRIEAALTGKPERLFDHYSGRWQTIGQIKENYDSIHKNAIASATYDVVNDFATEIKKMYKDDEARQTELIKSVSKMMAAAYNNGGIIYANNFDKDDEDSIFSSGDRSNNRYSQYFGFNDDEYREALKVIFKNKKSLRKFAQNVANSKASEASTKRMLEEQGGVYLDLFNDAYTSDELKKKHGKVNVFNGGGLLAAKDELGRNVYWYLRNILGELNYMRTNTSGLENSNRGYSHRRRVGSPTISTTPVDMDKFSMSIAKMDEEELKKEKARLEAEDEEREKRELLSKGYSYFETDEEKKRKEEEKKKGQRDSFLAKLYDANTIQARFSVIMKGLRDLTAKPGEILANVITKADQRMFDLMFGVKNLKTKDGRTAKGFVDFLIIKTEESFDRFKDYIEKNILDKLKAKYGDKFNAAKQKVKDFLTPYGSAIKRHFKNAKNTVMGAMGRAYSPVTTAIGNYFTPKSEREERERAQRIYAVREARQNGMDIPLTQDEIEEAQERNLDTFMENARGGDDSYVGDIAGINNDARGRFVTKTGLTIVSPGEMIIPSSFDKRVQKRQLKNELKLKRSILRDLRNGNIATNAEGTVDSADQVPGNENNGQKIKDNAINFASKISGEDPKIVSDFMNKFMDSAPDVVGGAAVGGVAGLFIGGPVLGAAIGAAVNITKRSKTVQKWLFGDEKNDGLISKRFVDKVNKILPDLKTYGIAGAVTGLVTPFGPVGGLLIGSSIAYAKNNQKFQEFLFGRDGLDNGLISKDFADKVKTNFPKLAVGAAGAALLGPFGLLGNAAMGTSLAFLSTTDTFKDVVFGEKVNGRREGGIIGGLKEGFVDPIKKGAKELVGTAKEYVTDNILEPLKDFAKPMTQAIKNITNSIGKTIRNAIHLIFDYSIGRPIKRMIANIGKGVTNVFGKLFKIVTFLPSKLFALPFKALGGIGNAVRRSQIRRGTASDMTAKERLAFRRTNRGAISDRIFKDKTFDLDAMMANTDDIESLIKLQDVAGQFAEGGRYADRRFAREKGDAGKVIDVFLNETIDPVTGKSLYDQLGKKNSKAIYKAMATGDSRELVKALGRKTKRGVGLSQAQQDALLGQLDPYMKRISHYKDMRTLGIEQRDATLKQLEELFGRKFSQKDLEFLNKNLGTEINARKLDSEAGRNKGAVSDFKDEDVNKLNDTIMNGTNAKLEDIYQILTYGVNLMQTYGRNSFNGKNEVSEPEAKNKIRASRKKNKSNRSVAKDLMNKRKSNYEINAGTTLGVLQNVFGADFTTTVPDINNIDIRKINTIVKYSNKLEGSTADELLKIADDQFELVVKILPAISFKLRSIDFANIVPRLNKNNVSWIVDIHNSGFEITDSSELFTLLTEITSKEQVKLIKDALKNVKVPKSASDLIKYSDPTFVPTQQGREGIEDEELRNATASSTGVLDRFKNKVKSMATSVMDSGKVFDLRSRFRSISQKLKRSKTEDNVQTVMSKDGHEITYVNGERQDDKNSVLGQRAADAEEKREEEMHQSMVEMNTTMKAMFTNFFGRAKDRAKSGGKKAKGILGKLVENTGGVLLGAKKFIKYLGLGALAAGGTAVAITHSEQLKQFASKYLTPVLDKVIKPAVTYVTDTIGNFVFGGGLEDLLVNKVFPALGNGVSWAIENGIAPLTAAIIAALPKVAIGIIKGLGSIFSLRNLLGANKKLTNREVSIDLSEEINDVNSRRTSGARSTVKAIGTVNLGDVASGDVGSTSSDRPRSSTLKAIAGENTRNNIVDYKTDSEGNLVTDENGNYIPVSDYYTNANDDTLASAAIRGGKNAFLNTLGGITPAVSSKAASVMSRISASGIGQNIGKVVTSGWGGKIVNGAMTGIKTVGKTLGVGVKAGENAANSLLNAVNGRQMYGPPSPMKSGLIGKIQQGIKFIFGKLANSKLATTILNFVKGATATGTENVISKGLIKLGDRLASAVGSTALKSAGGALKKLASKISNFPPIAVGLSISHFIYGWRNANTILGFAGEATIPEKLTAGLLNLINNVVLFGILPTSKIIDIIYDTILIGWFDFDTSKGLLAKRANAANVLDEWNAQHPEETYDNLEDFNNKDKLTTKALNKIKGIFGFKGHQAGNSLPDNSLTGTESSTMSVTKEINKFSDSVEDEMSNLDLRGSDKETDEVLKKVQDGKMSIDDKNFWKTKENGNSLGSALKRAMSIMLKTVALPVYAVTTALNTVSGTYSNNSSYTSTPSSTSTNTSTTTKSGGFFSRAWSSIKNFFTGNGRRSGTGRRGYGHAYQGDPSIANMRYGNGSINNTIRDAGCAPVAATNLINSMGGSSNVGDAVEYAVNNGFKQTNGGTDMNFFNSYLGAKGIPTANTDSAEQVRRSLKNGNQVVMIGRDNRNGAFGPNEHFITAKGYDKSGNMIIDDPDNPNANLKYRESQVLGNMQSAVIAGMGRRRRYGFGSLTQEEKNIITTKLSQITSAGESGGNYSLVIADDNGSLSVGSQQLHGEKVKRFFLALADKLTGEDAETAKKFAGWYNRAITSSEKSEMVAFLNKANVKKHSIEIQDVLNGEYLSGNLSTPMKMYEADELMDPRSMILAADIGNTGPAHLANWRKKYKKAATKDGELAHVRDSLMSTDSYWGSTVDANHKNHKYYNGWMNRIKSAYNALASWDGKSIDGPLANYDPNVSSSSSYGSSSSGSSSDGGTTNTLFSQITNTAKTILKQMYGPAYDALFGGLTQNGAMSDGSYTSADGSSINPAVINPSGNPVADRVISIALGEEGYVEKASNYDLNSKTGNPGDANYTKYAEWYGGMNPNPWCAMFVSWCAGQANIPTDVFPKHSYCPDGVSWFKSRGQWQSRGSYVPKRGDVIYFTNGSRASHVGLVVDSDGTTVYTIEGNTSPTKGVDANGGQVKSKSYSIKYDKILGYGVPDYASLLTDAQKAELENQSSTSNTGNSGGTTPKKVTTVDTALTPKMQMNGVINLGMGRKSGNSASAAVLGNKRKRIPDGSNDKLKPHRLGRSRSETSYRSIGFGSGVSGGQYITQEQMQNNASNNNLAMLQALLKIVENTDKLNAILAVLNALNGSEGGVSTGNASGSNTASTKAKLNQLLNEARSGSSNSKAPSSLLNNMDTQYIVSAMETIARQ